MLMVHSPPALSGLSLPQHDKSHESVGVFKQSQSIPARSTSTLHAMCMVLLQIYSQLSAYTSANYGFAYTCIVYAIQMMTSCRTTQHAGMDEWVFADQTMTTESVLSRLVFLESGVTSQACVVFLFGI